MKKKKVVVQLQEMIRAEMCTIENEVEVIRNC